MINYSKSCLWKVMTLLLLWRDLSLRVCNLRVPSSMSAEAATARSNTANVVILSIINQYKDKLLGINSLRVRGEHNNRIMEVRHQADETSKQVHMSIESVGYHS